MLTGAHSRIPSRTRTSTAVAVVVSLLVLGLPALAGAQTAQTAGGSGAYGGTQFYPRAVIQAIQCREGCAAAARASRTGWISVKEKGVLRIRGRNLRAVGEVLFLGARGRADNVGVKPQARTARTLDVNVPMEAGSGRVVLLDPAGRGSQPSRVGVRVVRSANSLSAQGFVWPLPTRGYLSGHYGEDRGSHMHSGIDLAAPTGTAIRAVAEGRVILVGPQGAYGNFTCLRHHTLVTCYAHQSRILVAYGQLVKQGQKIGEVGSTGRSSGPHLHFEVRQGPEAWTTPLDPFKYLPRRF